MAGKTHNYTRQVRGENYVMEAVAGDRTRFSMTAYGSGIQPGDYILLKPDSLQEPDSLLKPDSSLKPKPQPVRYQVEEIDYYSDPPDLWIAVLVQT